ncbi:predicted protein [Botrytis cinerea T4]|uniref:Uncharacterized protein n=1 Tax=Botryotinia fuckeliana (strain T4) TaxID=999810 RepID=G2YT30_BOTF4|nr:predicted protein [Botrytis cinerea T4]
MRGERRPSVKNNRDEASALSKDLTVNPCTAQQGYM